MKFQPGQKIYNWQFFNFIFTSTTLRHRENKKRKKEIFDFHFIIGYGAVAAAL
jgi:hypothetical protein|tara:strand:+ start:1592 stop:1750 length:159 start_codon:yes stop_codon:yes gene_type:complete